MHLTSKIARLLLIGTLISILGMPSDARSNELSVDVDVDRSSYSWFGTVTVTAQVTYLGDPLPDCDSVRVTSAANPRVRASLADDGLPPDATAGDGSYAGYFQIGGDLGEARPTGNYQVEAFAYRDELSGSNVSPSFSLYTVRRWTGITTGTVNDLYDEYTEFSVTSNGPGADWHHTIGDLGLVRSSAASDAQIRIPVLPLTNTISNVTVSGSSVSDVAVRGNVIEFTSNLTGGSVTRVTIEFDAPSDLAATYIDRYQTGDIGQRDFRNGYMVWNRYIHTGILGSDHSYLHGPGCIVDLQVTDLENGDPHTVDCMERVAVHLDDHAFNDGTGTYPSNIKWGGDAVSWFSSGDLGSMTFIFSSGGNYGLSDKVAVTKTVQFYSDSRMFRHDYDVRNIDNVSHDFDFVWGREQWLYGSGSGSNRQEDDRGMLPNDANSYGGEYGIPPAQIDGNWFAAFDRTSFYSIGVILPDGSVESMPNYAYFLCNPALGNFTGEYPIIPSGSCGDMENLFFEKRFGTLTPGESASYEFYQWGGYGLDRDELTLHLWRDAVSVSGEPLAIDFAPIGDGVPVGAGVEFWFNNPMDRATTEAALVLTPEPPGGGDWFWSDGYRHAVYYPTQGLNPMTIYGVELQRTASDLDGRSLATVASWYFETGTGPSSVASNETGGATSLLHGAAPNPFISSTQIAFSLPENGPARLSLYNTRGQRVTVLVDEILPAGRHVTDWQGTDRTGRRLASGIYFCRLETARQIEVRKIIIGR